MGISDVSNWIGVITGVIFFITSIYKIWQWFQKKIKSTQEGAQYGEILVTELLNNATNPARRADIHAYIQFHCTEVEAFDTRYLINSIAMAFALVFMGLILTALHNYINFELNINVWLWRIVLTLFITSIICFIMMQFYGKLIINLRKRWHTRASNVLRERALSHVKELT